MSRHLLIALLFSFACDDGNTAPMLDAGSFPDAAELDADIDVGPDGSELVVTTTEGAVMGALDEDAIAFKGIPYAAPPVGDLRWRAPERPAPWGDVLTTTEFSSPCVQPTGILVGDAGSSFGEEDCLYLNVWTPRDRAPDEALPVMVFLHGGGNIAGTAADSLDIVMQTESDASLYDGSRLSSRGRVVVVTLNYRLGVLGFLTHPELGAESPAGASGNYGLMDQIRALEWVQENAQRFGGDPERVLLFGQSGGARDVLLLTTSPKTDGLFSRAVIHSAPLGAQPAAENARQRALLVDEVACVGSGEIACMRELDPHTLVRARAAQPLGLASAAFRPSVDGDVVPEQPFTRVATGRFQPVPVILGTNENEYSHRWEDVTDETIRTSIAAFVGPEHVDAVLDAYPIEDYANAREAFYTLMSDRNVTCPANAFGRAAMASGMDFRLYRFREVMSSELRRGVDAYHTSELVFLFQHMSGEHFDVDEDDRATERVMRDYWTAFAATGAPDVDDLPAWPNFGAGEQYLDIDATPEVRDHLKADICTFWESLR